MGNLGLVTAVGGCWRRAHNNLSMPVGFDPPLDLREDWISQQLFPTPQVPRGLRPVGLKLNGQRRHGTNVPVSRGSSQLGSAPKAAIVSRQPTFPRRMFRPNSSPFAHCVPPAIVLQCGNQPTPRHMYFGTDYHPEHWVYPLA